VIRRQVVAYRAPLEATRSPDPEPRGTEVLLDVLACGVCHSDLHYWHGGYDLGGGKMLTREERGVRLPITLGHEPVGRIRASGPDAGDPPVGAVRLVYPWIGCGGCPRCAAGRDNDCPRMQTLGLFRPGGYATSILVPHPRYLLDIGDLDPSYACTLACAGVTAYTALRKAAWSFPDEPLVLIGGGGVGLTAVGMSRALSDRAVVVVDKDPAKLEAATVAGAAYAVDAGGPGLVDRLLRAVGGVGAVIDFVGSPETFGWALDLVSKGGRVVLVGLHGGERPLSMALLPLRNQSVVGSLTGTVDETRETVALVERGGIPRVPVHERPMSEATEALRDLEAGRVVGRTVLVP
jgi:propanol-preferring alcohol dehydrogenase